MSNTQISDRNIGILSHIDCFPNLSVILAGSVFEDASDDQLITLHSKLSAGLGSAQKVNIMICTGNPIKEYQERANSLGVISGIIAIPGREILTTAAKPKAELTTRLSTDRVIIVEKDLANAGAKALAVAFISGKLSAIRSMQRNAIPYYGYLPCLAGTILAKYDVQNVLGY